MKKMIWSFGIVFCIVVLAIGCVKKENSRTEHTTEQKYSKSFGEFYVSSKWGESQEHSTDDVFFYVKEGTEKQRQPDNIAVSIGKNPYSKEESESFKEAIRGIRNTRTEMNVPMNRQTSLYIVGKDTDTCTRYEACKKSF